MFRRPKPAHPRLVNEALSRAAMNVNRLFPIAGTGEAVAVNRAWLAAMKADWVLSMFAQKFAGVSACCPPSRDWLNGSCVPPITSGWPTPIRYRSVFHWLS